MFFGIVHIVGRNIPSLQLFLFIFLEVSFMAIKVLNLTFNVNKSKISIVSSFITGFLRILLVISLYIVKVYGELFIFSQYNFIISIVYVFIDIIVLFFNMARALLKLNFKIKVTPTPTKYI
jgi:hypothetical protein